VNQLISRVVLAVPLAALALYVTLRGGWWVALPAAVAAVIVELLHVPVTLDAAPPLRTEVGQWLAQAQGRGAVAVLPVALDVENTPAMVQSLEHRRPLVNGYSGQRPSFYPKLVDTLSTFPSDEALLALHDLGLQYIVAPAPIAAPADQAAWPLTERARLRGGTIYELTWTPEIEARFSRLSTVTPPPVGSIPFAPGEVARYSVTWDGAGVNLSAGEIVLSVDSPHYRLQATATTAPWVARFFEAEDRFVTTTDPSLVPLVHERDQREGRRHVTRAFVFDAAARRVRSGRTVADARGGAAVLLPLPDGSRDALAALYYVRTLPLTPGSRVQFPVNEAGRNLVVDVAVHGTEEITVGGRTVQAVRLEPSLIERVQRRRAVASTVWISADARRIPLKIDLSAGFGRLVLELVDYRPGH